MGHFPKKGTQTADLIHVCLGSGAQQAVLPELDFVSVLMPSPPQQEVREDAGEGKMRMRVPRALLAQDQWTDGPGSDRDVTSSC